MYILIVPLHPLYGYLRYNGHFEPWCDLKRKVFNVNILSRVGQYAQRECRVLFQIIRYISNLVTSSLNHI
jgi:hypothetical protein